MGRPLPHGHPYSREHVVYPTWYDQGNGHGPDRLCDELGCFCMSHECDCDVCTGVIDVPALKILNDSHEPEVEINMTDTIDVHLPAALRKWVTRTMGVETQDQQSLLDACKATGLGNSMKSTSVPLTNAALGVLIKQARKWVDSSNGNEVMAAKSVLGRHELDYEPQNLNEVRYGIKMPKSLSELILPKARNWGSEGLGAEVGTQLLQNCSWSTTGMTGRVGHEALGWLLKEVNNLMYSHAGPVPRAADKFIQAYRPQHTEQAEKWTSPEAEPKRLVVIACGGKKSDAPGKIPAEERYTGNYFQACRQASEVMDGATMVLSAKYGFIPLTEEIENYNVKMGGKDSVRLGFVRQQVKNLGLEDAKVTVLGGEQYVKAARQIWPDAEAPLKGGIGQQLKQLAGMYEGEALEDDQAQGDAQSREWQRKRMGDLVKWSDEPSYFYYGGSSKEEVNENGPLVYVSWRDSEKGKNKLIDAGTQELVEVVHSMSNVWAVEAEKPELGDEGQAQEPDPEPGQDKEDQDKTPLEYRSGPLRDIPNLPSRGRTGPANITFGGKAGKRNPAPGKWVKAGITYTGEGKYDIYDLATRETILMATLATQVHWAPFIGKREFEEWNKTHASDEKPAAVEEAQTDDEHQEPEEPTAGPARYEVPENFLELAEEANTDAAKRYWKRRCEEYAREGK
jgi:hypothetical protein